VQDKRSRGGQRPAVRKVMYWWDYLDSGSDLGLPDPSPIIGMDQVTAVYYASIAGGDPGAGDPEVDSLVFLANDWVNNEIQIYNFAGSSIGTGDVADVGIIKPVGLALDQEGKIWTNPGGDIFKFDLDGTELLDGRNANNGALVPTNKSDSLVFHGSGDILIATEFSDATTQVWAVDLGEAIHSIQQLENDNDFYVGLTSGAGGAVKRVNRSDGTVVNSRGKTGVGARAVAIDEVNGWAYHAFGNQIARVDLADNGDQKFFVLDAAWDIEKIVLYGGKVYVCGVRTLTNTVWRLDVALAGVEVDYDTGDTAHDMEFKGDILYVVGVKGTTEDAEDGNVNILDEDLVKVESPWNLGPNKELLAIAEKV
jgi:hypothetical protein